MYNTSRRNKEISKWTNRREGIGPYVIGERGTIEQQLVEVCRRCPDAGLLVAEALSDSAASTERTLAGFVLYYLLRRGDIPVSQTEVIWDRLRQDEDEAVRAAASNYLNSAAHAGFIDGAK